MVERDLSWVRDDSVSLPILQAAFESWRQAPPILFEIDPIAAWHLVVALQLAWRHPELPPNLKHFTERAGREIQALVVDAPALDDILEAGWRADMDIKRERTPRQST